LLFHEVVLDNKAPGSHEPRESSKEQEYLQHGYPTRASW
jgi:hypothetical protein